MIEDSIEFRSLDISEIENYISKIGGKKFRAKQIFKWIHKGIDSIDEMTNLSKSFRDILKNDGYICNMEVERKFVSKIDNTVKYLMRLRDNNIIECVVMEYEHGNTICISTQVGCSMGCKFCASTIGGKNRDLTSGEMLGQILKCQSDLGKNISNVVLMGAGEPLDNYENVIKFIRLVNDPEGINIGMRHITISTCGLIPEIKKLADLNLQITLAISLHAANDDVRKDLMPIANKYNMSDLMEICRYYIKKTNRRITFEYALINDVNDDQDNALQLARLLKGMLCHVNLIPVNKVEERNYHKSDINKIEQFRDILSSKGIQTTIRRELGSDINAACGQLRRSYIKSI